MEPVLAHDALNHAVLNRVFGVGVGPTTSAIQATEVLVVPGNKQSIYLKTKCTVCIAHIIFKLVPPLLVFRVDRPPVLNQLALLFWVFVVAAVAAEVPLGVELHDLRTSVVA